jgi:hypothetical protein
LEVIYLIWSQFVNHVIRNACYGFSMIGRITLGAFFGATLLFSAASSADVNTAREFELSWDLCAASTQAVEQATQMPRHLLAAISIAESGRRDDLNKINVAWPWTVTSGTEEWYADSKQQAIGIVEELVRGGVRNIDVGCMQINLYYHSDAFSSLEEAFDPLTNVSYAASYLKKLRKQTSSWTKAAGNYHSATPKYHQKYSKRLMEIWSRERRGLNRVASVDTMQSYYGGASPLTGNGTVPIDLERTAELNLAFKTRSQEPDNSISASSLGDSWKSAYTSGGNTSSYALQAQINRVRKAANEQDLLETMMKSEADNQAVKRASDLDNWRKKYNKALSSGGTSSISLY